MNKPRDLTPTVIEIKGKKISFYSPHQLEALNPVHLRLTSQARPTISQCIASQGIKHPAHFTHAV